MEKRIFSTALVTETAIFDREGIGTLRWVGNKMYRWVRNIDEATFAAGALVCHDLDDEVDLLKNVSAVAAADLGVLAGVVQASIVLTDLYFWIQVLGTYDGVLVTDTTDVTITAGDYLKGVSGQAYGILDSVTQPAYSRNIQIIETVNTQETPVATNSVAVLINCL